MTDIMTADNRKTMHDLAESKNSRGIVEKWPEGKITNLNKVDRQNIDGEIFGLFL